MWFFNKRRKTERGGVTEAGVGRLPTLGKVLLVAGGSAASLAATSFAVRLCAAMGARLLATYVVDTDSLSLLQTKGILLDDETREFSDELSVKGRRYLERIMALSQAQRVSAETRLVHGRFVQTMVEMTQSSQADLLVMGSWSDVGTRDLASRVRQTLLETVTCPVAVIKPPEAQG